jgi:hypothetical protein
VAGLLTVVADLRPGLVAPLGRTVGGSVTESTIKGTSIYHISAQPLTWMTTCKFENPANSPAVVAVATGSAGTAVAGDTSLGAVTGHV